MYRSPLYHHFAIIGLLFSVALFTACSTNVPQPLTYQQGGLTTFTATEDSETSLIKAPGNLHQFCAARESDAVSAPEGGISLGFGAGGIAKESVGATSGSGALSLGGRDPLVLITRELMYRVCELSINHNLSKEETIVLYKHFMDRLIDIAPLTKADGAPPKGIKAPDQSSRQDSSYDRDRDKYDSFDNFNSK
jgi:hypothetical protein